MAERNETGVPVIWGEPQPQPDGSFKTVVVAPGDPWPGQDKKAAKAAETDIDDGEPVTDQKEG